MAGGANVSEEAVASIYRTNFLKTEAENSSE
jgi:hypothetical protein